MKDIILDNLEDRFVVSFDKKLIDKDLLSQFLDLLRLESLARKVNFDQDIEVLKEGLRGRGFDNFYTEDDR